MKENGFKLTKERSRRYPVQTITDVDYAVDIALPANAPAHAKTQQRSVERAIEAISLHVNAHKAEYMGFNQTGDISTLKVSFCETRRQVHLPRKQCLINRDRHQYVTSKGMGSYQ